MWLEPSFKLALVVPEAYVGGGGRRVSEAN